MRNAGACGRLFMKSGDHVEFVVAGEGGPLCGILDWCQIKLVYKEPEL